MSNRLKNESSPYLMQHADNPIDWYPWGEEAFAKARKENKPIFLSIGYSTCHWCHVMAHESFENEKIAKILNQHFVSIKVDREERPDIDSVYMSVCQAFTGSGGWPMSIFMTAQQKPFFAGTYFPPDSRYGRIGFQDLLLRIVNKWEEDPLVLFETAEQILMHLDGHEQEYSGCIDDNLPALAVEMFSKSYDDSYGGFGGAPKFPTPHNLIFLMLYSHLYREKTIFRQVKTTLEKMRRGGIFDHIGFGFSRYSTDRYYLVPHFEKMLYDNALLIMAYSVAYKFSSDGFLLETAEQTAKYIFREMTSSAGAFYSAQDADSEGEEGKFYVFTYEEVCEVLGEKKGKEFCAYYGITKQGNFEGKNIPNLLNGKKFTKDYEGERKALYDYRKKRTTLSLDDKILASWNSLMICALTVLYRVSGKGHYLEAAQAAYHFMEENLVEGDTIFVSCRNQRRSVKGFLDEYAYYAAALLNLYGATSDTEYLQRAKQMIANAEHQFADEKGGYFLYGAENNSLITKPKETYDGALPSGNSVMAYCLVRLWQITGDMYYEEAAKKQLTFMSRESKHYPMGCSMFLIAQLLYRHPQQKITAVCSEMENRENIIARLPLFSDITILEEPTEEYKLLNNKTTYYVCKNQTCFLPTNQEPAL